MPADKALRNPSVVANARKLIANSSYGNQIMACSRHTVTNYYLGDEKTNAAINSKVFKQTRSCEQFID